MSSNPKGKGVKAKNPTQKSAECFFDLVVTNAIDFFNVSIKEFKERPKYSVIHFCSGLELILKARLLQEHWSLIVKRPEEAALFRFENGDFISVTVGETIKRLANITNETFSQDETKCFERLRDHRNKVVHFCHDAYSKKPDAKLLEDVAAEQCMAWCYLYRRLSGVWLERFKAHHKAIERFNKALHGHRIFLQSKFKTLRPDIEKEIAGGVEYQTCLACGCQSARVDQIEEPVHQVECRVCGTRDSLLRLVCPECQEVSDISDLATDDCINEECGAHIALTDVLGQYAPPRNDPKDQEENIYYCAACEQPEESATILGGKYFCFWCKQWFDTVEQCEFCGMHLVGFDSIESGYSGCFMCEDAAREHFYEKD